ncbi:hypothetical protein GCM10020220_012790 [Nonomuraea rubra]
MKKIRKKHTIVILKITVKKKKSKLGIKKKRIKLKKYRDRIQKINRKKKYKK